MSALIKSSGTLLRSRRVRSRSKLSNNVSLILRIAVWLTKDSRLGIRSLMRMPSNQGLRLGLLTTPRRVTPLMTSGEIESMVTKSPLCKAVPKPCVFMENSMSFRGWLLCGSSRSKTTLLGSATTGMPPPTASSCPKVSVVSRSSKTEGVLTLPVMATKPEAGGITITSPSSNFRS